MFVRISLIRCGAPYLTQSSRGLCGEAYFDASTKFLVNGCGELATRCGGACGGGSPRRRGGRHGRGQGYKVRLQKGEDSTRRFKEGESSSGDGEGSATDAGWKGRDRRCEGAVRGKVGDGERTASQRSTAEEPEGSGGRGTVYSTARRGTAAGRTTGEWQGQWHAGARGAIDLAWRLSLSVPRR